jgi:hypothetical protein
MHDRSVLFIQTSQADMVRNNEFDTIYHEHLSFFCANSMNELAQRAGLHLVDIQKTPIHGNSYLFVFSKTPGDTAKVEAFLKEERDAGLNTPATYIEYARKAQKAVEDLKDVVFAYRAEGYVIAGYGAAAKGMTLLNFGNLSLDFIIDERARELHWESHRRQDLIRFNRYTGGVYNWAWKGNGANGISIPSHLKLYPIPEASLASNPNLTQNPGY